VGESALYQYVVSYDPNVGFVTGGGWINSPAGACHPGMVVGVCSDVNAVGKANFGFVSKYQKGATIPTGETEFQFQVATFAFHSTSYDWLVVSSTTQAQYKGTGTINGSGSYAFLITAVNGSPDSFRIKIWDKTTNLVIYDNKMGSADTDLTATTALGGGSIVIHK